MAPSPRQGAIVGLLAILPVIAYTLGNADVFAAVAAGNVLLIVGSLWSMLGEDDAIEPEPAATHR
jgi:hypothetical protein